MSSKRLAILLSVLLVFAAAAAWWLWRTSPQTEPPAPRAPAAAAPRVAASAAGAPQASASAPLYPMEPDAGTPALAAGDVPAALEVLLGPKTVASFLQADEFARRIVATVDNLGREQAPAAVWPLHPTPGRFTVEDLDGAAVIGADNAARYTPLVLLAETVDMGQAADLYMRMYPLLQQAYREIGYPSGHFNDRLIQVIDLLLATPEVEPPLRLHLTEVKGPIPSTRPWVRYEFADPRLEALAAGQKMLVRVGPVNERRLKKKLAEFREEIVKRSQKR